MAAARTPASGGITPQLSSRTSQIEHSKWKAEHAPGHDEAAGRGATVVLFVWQGRTSKRNVNRGWASAQVRLLTPRCDILYEHVEWNSVAATPDHRSTSKAAFTIAGGVDVVLTVGDSDVGEPAIHLLPDVMRRRHHDRDVGCVMEGLDEVIHDS